MNLSVSKFSNVFGYFLVILQVNWMENTRKCCLFSHEAFKVHRVFFGLLYFGKLIVNCVECKLSKIIIYLVLRRNFHNRFNAVDCRLQLSLCWYFLKFSDRLYVPLAVLSITSLWKFNRLVDIWSRKCNCGANNAPRNTVGDKNVLYRKNSSGFQCTFSYHKCSYVK